MQKSGKVSSDRTAEDSFVVSSAIGDLVCKTGGSLCWREANQNLAKEAVFQMSCPSLCLINRQAGNLISSTKHQLYHNLKAGAFLLDHLRASSHVSFFFFRRNKLLSFWVFEFLIFSDFPRGGVNHFPVVISSRILPFPSWKFQEWAAGSCLKRLLKGVYRRILGNY